MVVEALREQARSHRTLVNADFVYTRETCESGLARDGNLSNTIKVYERPDFTDSNRPPKGFPYGIKAPHLRHLRLE